MQARKHYDFLDFLGDLGGILEIILITFGLVMYSVSEHSFHMQSMSRLFKARTHQEDLFANDESDSEEEKNKCKYLDPSRFPPDLSEERKKDIKLHRHI